MKEYIVELTPEEEKALLTDMISIQAWINNAIHNKARQCIDRVVEEVSEFQPSKIGKAQKLQIIKGAKIKTAVERQAELAAEMGE